MAPLLVNCTKEQLLEFPLQCLEDTDYEEALFKVATGIYRKLNENLVKLCFEDYVYPNVVEWSLLPIFFLFFVVGLVGNALVCIVVIRNESMITVTNMFLVNLAIADFLVILWCMPFTILVRYENVAEQFKLPQLLTSIFTLPFCSFLLPLSQIC